MMAATRRLRSRSPDRHGLYRTNFVPSSAPTRDKLGTLQGASRLIVPSVPSVPGRYIKVPLQTYPGRRTVTIGFFRSPPLLDFFRSGHPGHSGRFDFIEENCTGLVPGGCVTRDKYRPGMSAGIRRAALLPRPPASARCVAPASACIGALRCSRVRLHRRAALLPRLLPPGRRAALLPRPLPPGRRAALLLRPPPPGRRAAFVNAPKT
jgi:hypothetical protein